MRRSSLLGARSHVDDRVDVRDVAWWGSAFEGYAACVTYRMASLFVANSRRRVDIVAAEQDRQRSSEPCRHVGVDRLAADREQRPCHGCSEAHGYCRIQEAIIDATLIGFGASTSESRLDALSSVMKRASGRSITVRERSAHLAW